MGWKMALLLLVAAGVGAAPGGFLLTGPKILLKGSDETFCISIENDSEPLFTLDLISWHTNPKVHASVRHQIKGRTGCMTLSVPTFRGSNGRLRLRVQGAGADGSKSGVDEVVKNVGFYDADPIHLIETDKAWYTPGQLVRFRLLSLDHTLHPITRTIERVVVENPAGTTVAQWTNLTSAHGLHQLEMQLSSEPVHGVWKIVRESSKSSDKFQQEFEVREFVLPKFEVTIRGPPSIKYNAESDSSIKKISLDICAKYSYGQPVKGTWAALIEVTEREIYYFRDGRRLVGPTTLLRNGVLDARTGCHSLKLPSDQLGIFQFNRGVLKTVKVTAIVEERGTGIEMNSTWSTEVQPQSGVMLTALSGPDFKTFLPYNGVLKVSDDADAGLEGIDVMLCVDVSYDLHMDREATPSKSRDYKRCATYVSAEGGFVKFQLLATEIDIHEFKIKATLVSAGRKRRSSLEDDYFTPEDDTPGEIQLTVRRTFSRSNTSLSVTAPFQEAGSTVPCTASALPVDIYFTADGVDVLDTDIHYIVVSRGDLVLSGIKKVQFRPESDRIDLTSLAFNFLNEPPGVKEAKAIGSIRIDIPTQQVALRFGPKVSVLAYMVRRDAEVVTAHLEIPFDNCFPNPVKLWWDAKRRQPGEKATLNLKSGAGSLCGLTTVDRSVTFTRPDLQLSESKVYDPLHKFHISSHAYPYQVTSDYDYCRKKVSKAEEMEDGEEEYHRSRWIFSTRMTDAMKAFDKSGLLVISDLDIETRPCDRRRPIYLGRHSYMRREFDDIYDDEDSSGPLRPAGPLESIPAMPLAAAVFDDLMDMDSDGIVMDLSPTVAVRSYFPETWLWDLVTLDSSGEWQQSGLELPHTVTTWESRAVCVSEAYGFGMATGTSIEAFQPFFVELHMPYAAKRTEKLQVKVSVFNYVGDDLPVRLILEHSDQYQLIGEPSVQLCIPARDNAVHRFTIDADQLGTHNVTISAVIDDEYPGQCGPEFIPSAKDTVVKQLLVEPEGFPVERIYSHMACPKDLEEDAMPTWDLSLPVDVVEGSARAWFTAVGDLMGPALQGLSGLVRMPMGCGEQNMILFTPNIYVINYLEATKQLEESIKDEALDHMKQGYQRQLNYIHRDGSYSAFGKSDPSGSLWLTAFVVKSFAAARHYISIDDAQLLVSIKWLLTQQLENGCFPIVGTVLHKDLKGGLSDLDDNLAPLTAYTLIALLETSSSYSSSSSSSSSSTAFFAVNEIVDETLSCLEPEEEGTRDVYTTALTAYALALANRTEQCRHTIEWLMQHAHHDNSLTWWQKPGSSAALNVEVSSYVLLTLVKLGQTQDLMQARSIVRWLSQQRNSQGGFVSTQDTVVALQAIGRYALAIGAQEIDMKLVVVAGDFEENVIIKEADRLVQRRIDLPTPSTSAESHVSFVGVGVGDGCAFVQATLRYNVATAPESAAFELSVAPQPLSSPTPCSSHRLRVCARYTLSSVASSNMALIEVAMVSGYQAKKDSLHQLKADGKVKRFEVKDDTVVLYFDEIGARSTCFSLDVHAVFHVEDVKDSTIKVYDYYQPEHSTSTSYILPSGCVAEASPIPLPPRQPPPLDLDFDIIAPPVALPSLIVEPINDDASSPSIFPEPEGIHAAPLIDRGINSSASTTMDNFEDLDVPEGVEGPIGLVAVPGTERGCPRCLEEIDTDALETAYCGASTAFFAEARGTRLRLRSDISVEASPMNSTLVELFLQPHCQCSSLETRRKKNVSVLGLPALPHPSPPQKLVVGAELLIIEQNPRQLKLKSIAKKCNRVIHPRSP